MRKKFTILFSILVIFAAFSTNLMAQKAPTTYKNKEFLYRKEPAPLPNFYFYDRASNKIQINNFKGKVVVLNMWGTGCPTCVVELPMFSRLQRDMKDQVVVVPLSVGAESITDIMRLYQKSGVYNLEAYKDWNGELADRLNIKSIPTTLLIDPEGREIGRLTGMAEWDGPLIKSQVLKALNDYNSQKR